MRRNLSILCKVPQPPSQVTSVIPHRPRTQAHNKLVQQDGSKRNFHRRCKAHSLWIVRWITLSPQVTFLSSPNHEVRVSIVRATKGFATLQQLGCWFMVSCLTYPSLSCFGPSRQMLWGFEWVAYVLPARKSHLSCVCRTLKTLNAETSTKNDDRV